MDLEPGDAVDLFNCGNSVFNFDRDNVCTALTVDIAGNMWVAGKKRSKFSLFKVVQSTMAPAGAPTSASRWTQFTTPAGTFWAREYAAGRPLLVDLAVIDGDIAASFPYGGGLGGVIAVEERREVTFFPDSPQAIPVTIGRGGVWGLSRGELLQSATLLQKYLPAPVDTTRNWVLITTSSGRLLSRELPWVESTTTPVINHSTQANIVAPAAVAAACSGNPTALYDIQSSVKTRSIYVTDRRGCRALALSSNIDAMTFGSATTLAFTQSVVIASTNPEPLANPAQAELQSAPQAVSIAPGTALSMAAECAAGQVCPLVGDGLDTDDTTIPAASMTDVKLDPNTPDGLVVFQIQNIPDCRYIKKGLQPACLTAIVTPDGSPVQYDGNDFPVNPGQLFLNITPLLPLEVTRVKTIPAQMLLSPRYKATGTQKTFDALFGITADGVRFRDTFEANFDLADLIPGRKLGCGGEDPLKTLIDTVDGPQWDILVTISENFKTVGGLPNGSRQHTDMLVNKAGCDPVDPPAAGTRWSLYAYGLQMAQDIPATGMAAARYSDSILAKLTLSLFEDLGETIDNYACLDRDGGTGAPISSASCSSLQADWFNTNDKLAKCVESSTEPLNSTEIRACNAFEVQYAPFKALVDGLTKSPSASDPANRVGEVKARLEVFRYVYDYQFKPSIPPNTGFNDPLN